MAAMIKREIRVRMITELEARRDDVDDDALKQELVAGLRVYDEDKPSIELAKKYIAYENGQAGVVDKMSMTL